MRLYFTKVVVQLWEHFGQELEIWPLAANWRSVIKVNTYSTPEDFLSCRSHHTAARISQFLWFGYSGASHNVTNIAASILSQNCDIVLQ